MKIFYGICGEGYGHSGRSLALIERLSLLGHVVQLFTFGDALRMLRGAGLQPHPISGLHFGESRDGGVNPFATAKNFGQYLSARGRAVDVLRQHALVEQPDLFLTDFEPLTALAAASLKIPCVSLDSQHRFCQPLSRAFPWRLRAYGRLAGAFVKQWIKTSPPAIVAVFHQGASNDRVKRIHALIRDRITSLEPTDGDFVLLYGRGELGRRMVAAARVVPAQFVAYCGEPRADRPPNIEFRPASYDGFAADLAACRAVLCAGGQQLIGEARYFGKPLLVAPIPRQHEQEINARYAELEGLGEYCPIEQLSGQRINEFLNRRYTITRSANGVDQALELLGIPNGRMRSNSRAEHLRLRCPPRLSP